MNDRISTLATRKKEVEVEVEKRTQWGGRGQRCRRSGQ